MVMPLSRKWPDRHAVPMRRKVANGAMTLLSKSPQSNDATTGISYPNELNYVCKDRIILLS